MLFITTEQEITWTKPQQILHFYSVRDPFCQKNIVVLDKIEAKNLDAAFFAIDVDYFTGLVKRYEILTFQTTLVFKDNEEKYRLTNADCNFLSFPTLNAILADI